MSNNGVTRVDPPKQPMAPNAKWCHRFFIPMTYAEQRPNPLNPREPLMEMKSQGVFVKCLGDQCAIWDEQKNQCCDKTSAQSAAANAELEDRKFRTQQLQEMAENQGIPQT